MRILIADDHPLVQAGIVASLKADATFEVVGLAGDAGETLALVCALQPDIVILDLCMPGLGPAELAFQVRDKAPSVHILVFSSLIDESVLRSLSRSRISGYLLKDETPEHLVQALRTVREGATWFSRKIAEMMLSLHQTAQYPELTRREREILLLLAEGESNAAIAATLSLAEQTVRNHVSGLYDKLCVQSRAEAIVWVRRHLRHERPGWP